MPKIRVGHFLGDGGIVYLPLGFIPDYFRLCDIDSGASNAVVTIYEWFERMEDDEANGSQEGWAIAFATAGYTTLLANDAGITAYDTSAQHPASGTGAGQLSQWAGTTGYTARSGSLPGSYVKGTITGVDDTGQIVSREAIFECVSSGGSSGGTEPVWPSAIGGQILDGTPLWERVNTPLSRGGYQGVVIQDDIQSDSREYYYLAIKADESIDHGDVDSWPSGVDANWK